jgi:hypothetical protein
MNQSKIKFLQRNTHAVLKDRKKIGDIVTDKSSSLNFKSFFKYECLRPGVKTKILAVILRIFDVFKVFYSSLFGQAKRVMYLIKNLNLSCDKRCILILWQGRFQRSIRCA